MLVVKHLLIIMLTQRSSCIGRLQVEKHVSWLVEAWNVTYFIVHEVNQYMVKRIYGSINLSWYVLDINFISSCIGTSQPKNMHLSLNIKSSWLTWIGTRQKHCAWLTDDAIKYMCIWALVWCSKYKPYNSSTPLQHFLPFHSSVKEKGKQWRMKGFAMVQWLLRGLAMVLPLACITKGRLASQQMKYEWVSKF